MGYFDTYKNRLTIHGDNYAEINKNLLKQKINNSFKNSPSYVECGITNNSGLTETKGVIIVDNNTLVKSNGNKVIFMQPSDVIEIGNLVNYNSNVWLCTMSNGDVDLYRRGIIEESNYTLKFKSPTNSNIIISTACIVEDAVKYSSGIDENKIMNLPDGQLLITLTDNELTKTLKQDYRLMLYDKAFKVTYDNRTQNGLVKLTVVQVAREDQDTDEVAWNPIIPIEPTPTGTLIIYGSDNITINRTQSYEVKMDDGTVHSANYRFDLSDNTLAVITEVTNMTCVVKGLNKGNLILTATNLVSGQQITKSILVKSLL